MLKKKKLGFVQYKKAELKSCRLCKLSMTVTSQPWWIQHSLFLNPKGGWNWKTTPTFAGRRPLPGLGSSKVAPWFKFESQHCTTLPAACWPSQQVCVFSHQELLEDELLVTKACRSEGNEFSAVTQEAFFFFFSHNPLRRCPNKRAALLYCVRAPTFTFLPIVCLKKRANLSRSCQVPFIFLAALGHAQASGAVWKEASSPACSAEDRTHTSHSYTSSQLCVMRALPSRPLVNTLFAVVLEGKEIFTWAVHASQSSIQTFRDSVFINKRNPRRLMWFL